MKKIELLAPAGSKEAFLAAIAAGANAVYFGTNQFNARERAENIKLEDLPELISIAKNYNVRTYLTLNVLIYNHEIQAVLELVKKIIEIGVDAVIVQDIGLIYLLRKNFPDLEIHASTQLTTHNIQQCELLCNLGVKQINLSRELFLEEIKPVAKYLQKRKVGCEIFVHGAYCISYSGQCYLSGHLYNLKGNRGSCVQPCRRQYFLEKAPQNLFAPFNLKDNCAFSFVKELYDSGATSLKIEGRIKNAEYVYAVTKAWREQIDRLYQNQSLLKKDQRLDFSMNRSFSSGYLENSISKEMFTYGHKDHSIVLAGKVFSYHADKKTLSLQGKVLEKLKEGYLLTILNPDKSFVCTAIIESKLSEIEYKIKITGKLSGKIYKDVEVYYTKELISKEELKEITSALKPKKQLLNVSVKGNLNEPLSATFSLDSGESAVFYSKSDLQKASNKALSKEVIEEKFSKLGGTSFQLEKLELSKDFSKDLFLPLGELNEIRRQAVEYFQNLLEKPAEISDDKNRFDLSKIDFKSYPVYKKTVPVFMFSSIQSFNNFAEKNSFVPNTKYVSVLLEMPLTLAEQKTEYLTFFENNPNVVPYFCSILFENYFDDVKAFLIESKIKTIIADNLGLLVFAKENGIKVITGYHLNVFNSFSAYYFANEFGIKDFFVSPELSEEELSAFDLPQNTNIWHFDKNYVQLMQSRQCLLRNIPNAQGVICSKEKTDDVCIKNCSRTEKIIGMQKEAVTAKKRPGFYSALYPCVQAREINYKKIIETMPEELEASQNIMQIFYV